MFSKRCFASIFLLKRYVTYYSELEFYIMRIKAYSNPRLLLSEETKIPVQDRTVFPFVP